MAAELMALCRLPTLPHKLPGLGREHLEGVDALLFCLGMQRAERKYWRSQMTPDASPKDGDFGLGRIYAMQVRQFFKS
jgi:hypothetical protein